MRSVALLSVLAVMGGCADARPSETRIAAEAKEAARLTEDLAGYTAGEPRRCLPRQADSGIESYGEKTLVFRVSSRLVYRNDVRSGSCPRIGNSRALITTSYGSGQLCNGDRASSADLVAGFETGFCILGDFTPYRKTASR
jgi:hypothetical protein